MLAEIPLGRFAEPDEVVEPILFLLSDAASMVSGVSLPIDGGYGALANLMRRRRRMTGTRGECAARQP